MGFVARGLKTDGGGKNHSEALEDQYAKWHIRIAEAIGGNHSLTGKVAKKSMESLANGYLAAQLPLT